MLGFNQALHIAIVPFPYPFAQLIAFCITMLIIIMPVMSVSFTPGVMLAPFMSFVVVFGFWNLNSISIELEQPFGVDPNDLPVRETHENFVTGLRTLYLATPRVVNMRQRQENRVKIDRGVATLNAELDRQRGAKARFSSALSLDCYLAFTVNDLEKKFKSTALAHKMHARLREVKQDEDDRAANEAYQNRMDSQDEEMVVTLGTFTTKSAHRKTVKGRTKYEFAKNIADFQSLAETLNKDVKGKDLVTQVTNISEHAWFNQQNKHESLRRGKTEKDF
jgi:predicted membrane chloride channel (bestrophin family)